MTHREARVYLDADEARCEPPALACTRSASCGRYLAAYPAKGRRAADFTAVPGWSAASCGGYIQASKCVLPPSADHAPRVHPPLGSCAVGVGFVLWFVWGMIR